MKVMFMNLLLIIFLNSWIYLVERIAIIKIYTLLETYNESDFLTWYSRNLVYSRSN